jgi:CO/xanthine dehydrogenase FAD-binding subunit
VDLHTITALHRPRDRAGLTGALGEGVAVLAGGTFLFAQPQPDLHTLVDLTGLGWAPVEDSGAGLRIAATCTIAGLVVHADAADHAGRPGLALVRRCAESLLGSFKVWNVATVGGNVCLGLPAGPMISLTASLDGVAEVWCPDGGRRRVPVAELVTGANRTALRPGEVLRAIELPAGALASRVAFRRASLAEYGRSGALVIGRLDPAGAFVLTVTAATDRPYRFAFDRLPGAAELSAAVDGIDPWFDDPHGAPDWRRAVTLRLAEEVRAELGDIPGNGSRNGAGRPGDGRRW